MDASALSARAQRRSLGAWIRRPGFLSTEQPWLWYLCLALFGVGVVAWVAVLLSGSISMGVTAMWSFGLGGVLLAFLLPFPHALVAPLYVGVAGWLVDMLPLVILVVWAAVAVRWVAGLIRERRRPRGGRWVWIPIGLAAWTVLGLAVVGTEDLKHFLLLLGLQILASVLILAMADRLTALEDRIRTIAGLVGFVVLLSAGVLLQWVGVPIQEMQESVATARVEAAYGLDAFPNITGMIKYSRNRNAGLADLRERMAGFRAENPGLPKYDVFIPKFKAFRNQLVIRFEGSARQWEEELARDEIYLEYDNVGLTLGNTIPRMRSFPRNALTYAGISAVAFPLALFLLWTQSGWRRWLGGAGLVSSLFGVGFSLARGAWVATLIGLAYLVVDGVLSRRRKIQAVAAVVAGALVLVGVFLIKYERDPLTVRAQAEGSVTSRAALYGDTVRSVKGLHYVIGFGTEKPRRDSVTGSKSSFGRYIPAAGTHSTYLNYLFRVGVPGLLGISLLYALAGLHARAAARQKEGDEALLSTLVAAAVVIAAAHAVVLSLFVEPAYALSIMLIMGLAMAGGLSLPRPIVPGRRTSSV